MKTLKGDSVFLRALEPEDLNILYKVENNEDIWEISNTITPFSKFVLQQYLDNSLRDIFEVKQLRLVICLNESSEAIGFIDLFEFDPTNKRVGVGILIFNLKQRENGYAKQSLQLLINYAFKHLAVHQIFANITDTNIKSIALFEGLNFIKVGSKKDWLYNDGTFQNEVLFQLIQNKKF